MEPFSIDRTRYDEYNEERLRFKADKGLSEELVRQISAEKNEPAWMLELRLKALALFNKTPLPNWGPSLAGLELEKLSYYLTPQAKKNATKWEDVPEDIKRTFDRLGIPEAEKRMLAGTGAQYESEVVYHSLKEELSKQGVVFLDMDRAVHEHEDLVKEHFSKCIPINDHKFIMLHYAVWSGGSFIYIPKGIRVEQPLQAYFRMNAERGGQFEHTLIIADEDSSVSYVEGCFVEGTLIKTKDGIKKIEEIQEKDNVLTSEGMYKKTKDIQRIPYTGNLYSVETYGDPSNKITTTENHPFLYVDRKYRKDRNKVFKPRWNTPRFFKKADYLCVPIDKTVSSKKTHTFTVINNRQEKRIKVNLTKEFYRLVGYYLAEGSVSSDSYLNFSFGINEKEYHDDVKKCLKKALGVTKVLEMKHKKNNGLSLVVCSVDLARIFKQFGTQCDKKRIPQWMMHSDPKLQKEIVKGFFYGDGNYYRKQSKKTGFLKESIRINTTSKQLTFQCRDILLRLGVAAFINTRIRKKEKRKTMYTIGATGEHIVTFGKLVGIEIPSTLNGKKRASMFGIDEKFAYLPIKKVSKRKVTDKIVYNFGVTDHETYTANGFAVHNCSAPKYNSSSLHAGGVELFIKKGAHIRYSSVENWSTNTYNLNTKRSMVSENGRVEWIGGNLGCLIGSSNVSTEKGPVPINKIKKGTKVFSWNKNTNSIELSKVLATKSSGRKKVYEITVAGKTIQASSNHPFLTLEHKKNSPEHYKGFFHHKWTPLEKLKEGDIIAIAKKIPQRGKPYKLPKYNYNKIVKSKSQYAKQFDSNVKHLFNKISFPAFTNEDFMWFLGIMIGDGHIWIDKNSGGAKINIAIPETSDLRKALIKTVKKLFNYNITYRKDRYVVINSLPLAELLIKIGIGGNADTKNIPDWVFGIPEEQQIAFLAGYFDSDGHAGPNGIYYTSCNRKLLEKTKTISQQCGYGTSHIFKHSEAGEKTILGVKCQGKGSWRLLLNGVSVKKIPTKSPQYEKKIAEIKTKRRFNTIKGKNFSSKVNEEIGFARIIKIETKGTKETYDIEVEKNHNFIAEGFIVHNSGVTMLYPCSILKGDNAHADHLSIAFAAKNQNQDTGAKVYHIGKKTTSTIVSKSISNGGTVTYRGIVQISKNADKAKTNVECDSMMIGTGSVSNTYPVIDIRNKTSQAGHEARVGKIGEEQLFYLQSRGLDEETAINLIISGFMEPITKELPLEYAMELNKLIEMEIHGVG